MVTLLQRLCSISAASTCHGLSAGYQSLLVASKNLPPFLTSPRQFRHADTFENDEEHAGLGYGDQCFHSLYPVSGPRSTCCNCPGLSVPYRLPPSQSILRLLGCGFVLIAGSRFSCCSFSLVRYCVRNPCCLPSLCSSTSSQLSTPPLSPAPLFPAACCSKQLSRLSKAGSPITVFPNRGFQGSPPPPSASASFIRPDEKVIVWIDWRSHCYLLFLNPRLFFALSMCNRTQCITWPHRLHRRAIAQSSNAK